jgi:hypothetical protein
MPTMLMSNMAKLDALKHAAKLGMASLEAGEVRSFASTKALERHLDQLAVKALCKTKRPHAGEDEA